MNEFNEPSAPFLQEVLVRTKVRHPLIVRRCICDKKTVAKSMAKKLASLIVMDKFDTTLNDWLPNNTLDYPTCIGFISDLLTRRTRSTSTTPR